MIVRDRRKIDITSREISFTVAFTASDVRDWVKDFYYVTRLLPFDRETFKTYLKESHLHNFQLKYVDDIADWAWNIAVDEEMITDGGELDKWHLFLPTDMLVSITQKRQHKRQYG